MKQYKNGDRCPCCGRLIQGKDEDWLELFSSTMFFLGLSGSEETGEENTCQNPNKPTILEST